MTHSYATLSIELGAALRNAALMFGTSATACRIPKCSRSPSPPSCH